MVARINWADPITRGLKFAAVLHSPQRAEDLTKGLRPVASDGNGLAGGPTFAVDSEGPHVFHPDEQAHYLHYGPHTDYDVTTQATWLFRFRIPSSTSINADIFAKGRYYTSGKAWAFQYQTDNAFRLTVETNFYDIFTGTPALDTDVLTTVGLTYDKDGGTNNLKTYRDGEYNRGHTTSAITIPTTSDPITLGGNDNGDGAFPIHYYFAYLWNRVLTAEEIARLQRDPYCFLVSAPALPTEEALAYPAAPAGGGTSDVSVTDTASGSEAVGVAAAVPGADTGSGTEAPTVEAAAPGADAGTGTEAPTVGAAVPTADSGAGTETSAVAAAVPVADTGTGAEAPVIEAAVPGTDTGTGSEAPTVAAAVGVSDTSTGSDSALSDPTVPAGDTGSGSEGVVVYVSIDVGDAGAGAESASGGTGANIGDTGVGAEGIDIAVTLGLADTGTGTDSRSIDVGLGVGDAGSGSETASGVAGAFITDFGAGLEDVLVAAGLAVGDAAAGAEGLAGEAAFGVADAGSGFDVAYVPESHPPYNTPIRIARLRGTITRTARLNGGARIARPTPPED